MNSETKQAIGEAVENTVEAAEEAVQKPGVKFLARFGFYSKGFLFILIGVLAILLVVGLDGGRLTDPTGALSAISHTQYGKVILLVFIAGSIGHGIWNILRGAADIDDAGRSWQGIAKRSISIGAGLFYIGLALSTSEIVMAARVTDASSHAEETFTSILLAIPLGAVFIALVGLCVIGAGFHECYSGLTGKYRENYRSWEIDGFHLSLIKVLGTLGFTARALLLILLGYFFISAAFYNAPGTPIGLDAALLTLLGTTYGKLIVLFTAIGLVSHGILAFYEARFRKIC